MKDKLKDNTVYNFAAGVNQRSLFNNYVWTAVGGLHKEEHSMANSYTEEYTGASSFKFALGAEINADIGTPFGGYYVEADVMLGGSWSMSASKSSAASNGFSLQCVVTPTGFLSAPKNVDQRRGCIAVQWLHHHTSARQSGWLPLHGVFAGTVQRKLHGIEQCD